MNREKLNSYVALYKQHFDKISDDEVYKWKAVKRFNENWDINAIDFPDMLERTFDFKGNLLVSKNFLPLDTIKVAVNINSVMVREMFNYLYDENILLSDRIIFFRNGIEQILGLKGQNLNDYHGDGRAIMVYLSFKYPDKYYLYKYEMFNEFCAAIDYEGKPGLREDLLTKIHKYTILCNTVKHELERDTELLLLHNRRLNKINCTDPENNLLTQDFIYAVQYHFKNVPLALTEFVGENVVVYLQNTYLLKENAVNLNARIVDFDKRNRNISRIGRKGEEFVLETEKNILKRDGINKIPEHTSVIKGDGIGYDILSYRKVENKITPIKIEVKTTTGSFYNDFYITANELEASKLDSDRYYLYRVYDFNEEIMSGNIHIEKGSLEKLTNNPINYKVILSKRDDN